MTSIEEALGAWRAAERRVQEANGGLTPEIAKNLALARQRYQDLAAAHKAEQIDAPLSRHGQPESTGRYSPSRTTGERGVVRQ